MTWGEATQATMTGHSSSSSVHTSGLRSNALTAQRPLDDNEDG